MKSQPARTQHLPTAARALLTLLAVCAAWTLVSCSGGDSSQLVQPPEGGTRTATAATALPTAPDARAKGVWGPVYRWPLVSVHAVLLPDGRVMSYGSRADGLQTGNFLIDLWDSGADPDTGHTSLVNDTGVDLFCSSQLLLPPAGPDSTPRVFIAGGDIWNGSSTTSFPNDKTVEFDAPVSIASRAANLGRPRWYSTSITLADGQTYIQGGAGGIDRPELRLSNGGFRLLSGIDTTGLNYLYPRNFVLPDSRVFGFDADGKMYFINPAGNGGNGSMTPAGSFAWMYGGSDSSVAMFRPGRILQIGGSSNGAIVIDVTGSSPLVTPTQSISSQRRMMTASLLPDGQVLVTGGSSVSNQPIGVNNSAEMWDPRTGQWYQGAVGAKPRLYHSNAVLLPDASVLVTSGGASYPQMPDAIDRDAQIYYPPYLFTPTGERAPRPVIGSAADWLEVGKTFNVQTRGDSNISRVTLVKTASSTHGWNMEQRFLDLPFTRTAVAGGQQLSVQAPARAGEATPGYYMLFVFDDAGVPSQARVLRLALPSGASTQGGPVMSAPGARSGAAGIPQSMQLVASAASGAALSYSAAGLPPGLVLNATTGLISGAATATGSYDVVVAASDGVRNDSASFVWTVTAPSPLSLTQVPTPNASIAGTSVTFSAAAQGADVQYQWNFGDGSGDSAWSSAASTSRAFASPGTYVVTLRVRDAQGSVVSRSFLQSVYLPATATLPSASTNLLLQPRANGNARLWVVNQDNDSITAFDTQTITRLGEVAVGAAPRSIALSPQGRLWVTNKSDASISIVNPDTLAVERTLALPRASQPFGLAMSPVASQAFVVLEATGQLLRLDTASGVVTGSLALGANVRHVSVTADGASVFVSRFITPPMPGESSATVATPADRGGEVLQVNADTMTIARTVVLAYSDRTDSENQGSGIPNYLGPAVISPDGSQAYVPSKQDNILRGSLRSNAALNFQNTVRAISSRLVLTGAGAGREDLSRRVDHDNASVASAAAFDPRGVWLFVALETSREVAVVDAHTGVQVMRFDVGRAPQGLAVSADGSLLYVNNFMDRSVSVHDLRPLLGQGVSLVTPVATVQAVLTDRLPATVLAGKQLFYDARDTRLARDRYMSCATCHNDGGHDGRVWDFTHAGEGLRNTISLRGRAGGQGRLHWSANFDEVQDFEAQIRSLAGGTGLMTDTDFNTGTRSLALGDRKAGISADLDALAAYVVSLDRFAPSPARAADGQLTPDAVAGRVVFTARCASCHEGAAFTDSGKGVLHDVGTRSIASGHRLGLALNGIDVPTLRDVWATAPYLHNGAAPTLEAAVQAHGGLALSTAELDAVVSYTRQIGAEEPAAPASNANLVVRVLATLMDKVGALYEVRVNGLRVGGGQLDATAWVDLFFDVTSLVKDAVVEVLFLNDANSATEDRNLAVQSIRVNGSSVVEATVPGVLLEADGHATVTAASTGGWMPWDATMVFKAPDTGSGDTVSVRAAASLAGGVGAQMELRINGAIVGTRLVSSPVVEELRFSTPPVQAGDRIDVVFTNDAVVGNEDRNLYIESVTARGVVLPSTAPEAVLNVGDGAQAFDGVNLLPGNSFGGWVPWNGALRLVAR